MMRNKPLLILACWGCGKHLSDLKLVYIKEKGYCKRCARTLRGG